MLVECVWNLMAHGDARERKWRGNWRMEWVASTLHTTSERGVSSITTADAHTSADSSRLNWRPRRFKWTRPFGRKTKSGFCACAIMFQTRYTYCNHPSVKLLLCVRFVGRNVWCTRMYCGYCPFQIHTAMLRTKSELNTLWTGHADLRLYITTVLDGWRKSAFLTRAWFPRTTHLITQYMEHFSEWSRWRMFIRGLEL